MRSQSKAPTQDSLILSIAQDQNPSQAQPCVVHPDRNVEQEGGWSLTLGSDRAGYPGFLLLGTVLALRPWGSWAPCPEESQGREGREACFQSPHRFAFASGSTEDQGLSSGSTTNTCQGLSPAGPHRHGLQGGGSPGSGPGQTLPTPRCPQPSGLCTRVTLPGQGLLKLSEQGRGAF